MPQKETTGYSIGPMNIDGDESYIEEPTEIIDTFEANPSDAHAHPAEVGASPIILDDVLDENVNVMNNLQGNLSSPHPIPGTPGVNQSGIAKSFQPAAMQTRTSFFMANGSGEESPFGDYSGDSRPDSPSVSAGSAALHARHGITGRGRGLLSASSQRSRSLDPNLTLRRV